MNQEFERYKELLLSNEKPPTTETCSWNQLETHEATKEEELIMLEAKRKERKVLLFVAPVAILFLLVSVCGFLSADGPKAFFLVFFGVDLFLWIVMLRIFHNIRGNERNRLVYGFIEYIYSERERYRDSNNRIRYRNRYYADFYIPTARKYLKRVSIDSDREKLERNSHVALYSFRVGVPDFLVLDEHGDLM